MRTYQVGLIGCGAVAADFHLPAIGRSARARLVACCDSDRARAQACADRHGATFVTGDAAALLARPDIDLVVIATPPSVTPHLAAAALRAGKAVLAEKPIA